MIGLKVLNSDASVNNFSESLSAQVVRGSDALINLRITQLDKNGLRYIPAAGATFSLTLQNSDGTTVIKTPTQPFSDDKSVVQFSLNELETELLISQNLNLQITESSKISYAILPLGFQVITLNSDDFSV